MYLIRPWLAVGKLSETYSVRLLAENNIGAMLQIAENVEQPAIISLYLPVEDGEPLASHVLQKAVAFIREQKEAGRTTLVACGLGISRSVTFATAALKEIEGRNLLDAFVQIKQHHPEARPHPVLWLALCNHYGEVVPYLKVLRLSGNLGHANESE